MMKKTEKRIKIVYVEDEPSIAQLLVSGLGLFGIEVHPVYSNAEALLENIEDGTYEEVDIFFFDIRLPKMTGVELATILRERGEKRPFVLVSAWPRPEAKILTELNAAFLPKPFDFPDVVATIQNLSQ